MMHLLASFIIKVGSIFLTVVNIKDKIVLLVQTIVIQISLCSSDVAILTTAKTQTLYIVKVYVMIPLKILRNILEPVLQKTVSFMPLMENVLDAMNLSNLCNNKEYVRDR